MMQLLFKHSFFSSSALDSGFLLLRAARTARSLPINSRDLPKIVQSSRLFSHKGTNFMSSAASKKPNAVVIPSSGPTKKVVWTLSFLFSYLY